MVDRSCDALRYGGRCGCSREDASVAACVSEKARGLDGLDFVSAWAERGEEEEGEEEEGGVQMATISSLVSFSSLRGWGLKKICCGVCPNSLICIRRLSRSWVVETSTVHRRIPKKVKQREGGRAEWLEFCFH